MKMRVLSAPLWASSPSHTAPGAAKSHRTGPIPPVRTPSAHQAEHPREGKRAQNRGYGQAPHGPGRGHVKQHEAGPHPPWRAQPPSHRAIFQLLT